MKLTMHTPDFKAKESLLNFVEGNVSKIGHLTDKILESQVSLKLDKSATRENKICDIRLVIPGNDLFASKRSTSFEDAVMQSIEALKPQVARWKDENHTGV